MGVRCKPEEVVEGVDRMTNYDCRKCDQYPSHCECDEKPIPPGVKVMAAEPAQLKRIAEGEYSFNMNYIRFSGIEYISRTEHERLIKEGEQMKRYNPDSPWKVGYSAMSVQSEDGMKICDIRGWGYLTGSGAGACGLSEDDAKAIQVRHANLIAGAQAMSDALHMWRTAEERGIDLAGARLARDKAIKKATAKDEGHG